MIELMITAGPALSVVGLIYLIIKLVILGLIYFALRWVAGFLGVEVPDIIWKILAVILVLVGLAAVMVYLGVG